MNGKGEQTLAFVEGTPTIALCRCRMPARIGANHATFTLPLDFDEGNGSCIRQQVNAEGAKNAQANFSLARGLTAHRHFD